MAEFITGYRRKSDDVTAKHNAAGNLLTEQDIRDVEALQTRWTITQLDYLGNGSWSLWLQDSVFDVMHARHLTPGDYIVYDPNIDTLFVQPEQAWQRMYANADTNDFLSDL